MKIPHKYELSNHLWLNRRMCLHNPKILAFSSTFRFIPKLKRPMNFLVDGQRETHKTYLKIISEQAESLRKSREIDENFQPDNVLQAFLLEKEKRAGDVSEKYYSNMQFLHLLADLFGAGLDTTSTSLR